MAATAPARFVPIVSRFRAFRRQTLYRLSRQRQSHGGSRLWRLPALATILHMSPQRNRSAYAEAWPQGIRTYDDATQPCAQHARKEERLMSLIIVSVILALCSILFVAYLMVSMVERQPSSLRELLVWLFHDLSVAIRWIIGPISNKPKRG